MDHLTLASTPADAAAVEAMEHHHAELSGALDARVSILHGAITDGRGVERARTDLVDWCDRSLLPHAMAEENVLYTRGLAMPAARLLVEAMLAEHRVIESLVDRLRGGENTELAAASGALHTLFEAHLVKENEQLLPLLAAAPDIALADLLAGMHELVGAPDVAPGTAEQPGHSCGCGEHDDDVPELDARSIPHAFRHATIFGALDTVAAGRAMVLIAPHDPLPLLAQLEQRSPGQFGVSYQERGPESWRLLLRRQ